MQSKSQPRTVKKPTLKEINSVLIDTPGNIRAQIAESLDISTSSVFAIIRGERVCSPAERAAIAKIYQMNVADIAWTEKDDLL